MRDAFGVERVSKVGCSCEVCEAKGISCERCHKCRGVSKGLASWLGFAAKKPVTSAALMARRGGLSPAAQSRLTPVPAAQVTSGSTYRGVPMAGKVKKPKKTNTPKASQPAPVAEAVEQPAKKKNSNPFGMSDRTKRNLLIGGGAGAIGVGGYGLGRSSNRSQ